MFLLDMFFFRWDVSACAPELLRFPLISTLNWRLTRSCSRAAGGGRKRDVGEDGIYKPHARCLEREIASEVNLYNKLLCHTRVCISNRGLDM